MVCSRRPAPWRRLARVGDKQCATGMCHGAVRFLNLFLERSVASLRWSWCLSFFTGCTAALHFLPPQVCIVHTQYICVALPTEYGSTQGLESRRCTYAQGPETPTTNELKV